MCPAGRVAKQEAALLGEEVASEAGLPPGSLMDTAEGHLGPLSPGRPHSHPHLGLRIYTSCPQADLPGSEEPQKPPAPQASPCCQSG